MKFRKTMNRKIAFIIAAAVVVGQIPVSALAEGSTTALVESAYSNLEGYTYGQEYDNYSSTSWTTFTGAGTHVKNMDNQLPGDESKTGYLEIKRDSGSFVFVEDQSPIVKDFEVETRFQLNAVEGEAAGRFGLVFRGTDASKYGFVGYNLNGKWLIETPNDWKDDIDGPVLESGEWVTMKVKLVRNNLTLTVNDEELFSGAIDLDNFPNEAGKFGYRTWYDEKTVNVDYLNIKSLDEVASTDIESVSEITMSTLKNAKPELPYSIDVTYTDGGAGKEVVIWDYIDPLKYSEVGTFTVEGTIKGADESVPKAKATITVRERISYATDFESPETSGNWRVLKPTGLTATVSDGNVKIPMNGVATAIDAECPDVKNFVYETEFAVNSDTGRIGLAFRVQEDLQNWGAICYDAGSWVWKAANNGTESYGSFPGSKKLEANVTYKMKMEVEDSKVTLYIDDELIGSATSSNFPTAAGKIGLSGWFGNKTITLDNVSVEEIAPETEADLPEVSEFSIESEIMEVKLDNTFPRVIEYNWKDDDSTLIGQEIRSNKININAKNYTPEVQCEVVDNKAVYTMAINEIGVTLTTELSVEDNKIRLEITDIKEEGDFVVRTVSIPNQSFATVRSDNGGAIAGVLSSGAWHDITDEIAKVENIVPGTKSKTYAFINDNDFAITLNNNTIEYSNRILLNTENKNGYKTTSMGTSAWTYREVVGGDVDFYSYEDNLWAEAYITKDMNGDEEVDWQDAAIEYRNRVEAPYGAEDIKNSLSYIAFNIGYTQSPFLRTLDTVKKLYNYTDGFGQMVLEKGYQGEGHDDVIPDYGGHVGIRQGGVEDFNTLIEEGAKYNAKIGVHINATEYQMDAFEYPDGIVNENAPGWGWLDQSYYADQRADLTSGELFRRLDMLKEDVPNLGWVYVDVYTGNGWNAHQLGEKLNDLEFQVATEFHSPLEEHVTWTHWGADPAYPNQGGTSEILRFVRNSTKDGFLASPLLKGNKHLLSNGWGNNHAIEGEKGLDTFYNQVLPTKYMQHFDIMKMTDDEVLFDDDLRAVREGADINYYKNGKLVATTPENTISSTGIGKTNLFLEWNFDEEEDTKIYHWNPFSTTSTWEVPDSWEGLANVNLYELTDLGRVEVGTVPVVNGKVTLEVEQNTPYLVTQGEVAQNRIDDWGYGSLIKDPGFDSQQWDTWTKSSVEDNTDHIDFVNETRVSRAGNDVVTIKDKQGSIAQEIEGLVPGTTYSVSAWVKNDSNRTVTLGVDCGDIEATNVITTSSEPRQGEGHKYLNDTFTRMEVEFTVPSGVTGGKVYLNAAEGEGEVIIDDFRIWAHPGHTNKDGYVFYEDFENVDEGITPFFLAPGRGTSNRTHLAEKDLLGRQKMNWVLDGRFSLKTNQQSGETGQMIITEESTLKLEANKTYELGFLYSLADAKPGYSVNIKSKTAGTLVNVPLEATGVESGEYTKTKAITTTFTTGEYNDYYMSIDKGEGYAELILDNIYVSEIDTTVENPVLDKVNLSMPVTEFAIGGSLDLSMVLLNGLMNNGSNVDLAEANVEYIIADNSIAKIEEGKVIGLKDGTTTMTVKVSLNESKKVVESNSVTIKVGTGSEGEVDPPVVEVNKDELKAMVESAEELSGDKYTTDSWNVLVDELEKAKVVLNNDKATQEEVNAAKAALEIAIDSLVEKDDEGEETEIDLSKLQATVEAAGKLNKDKYTEASWNVLVQALDNANKVLADKEATQAQVNQAQGVLEAAIEALEEKVEESKVDKSKLNALVEANKDLKESDYTASSWKKFVKALESAKKVLENEDATQKQVDSAVKDLEKAIKGLKKVSTNVGGNGNGNDNLPNTGGTPAAAVGTLGVIMATIGAVMFKKKK